MGKRRQHSATVHYLAGSRKSLIGKLHGRMATYVSGQDYQNWLNPDENTGSLLGILNARYEADKMQAIKVSRQANSIGNQGPELSEPIA